MAKEAIKKLEEQLNCSVCIDTYTSPKLLQCFHIFCQKCLIKLVIRDQQGQLSLTCPTCRQVTPVPADGVRGLQSAFHINHLLEIQESVKKIEDVPQEGAVGGVTTADITSNTVKSCPDHEEEVKLYCDTCDDLICYKCAIRGGKHRDHDYQPLNEAFKKYQEDIAPSLELIEEQLEATSKAFIHLETRCTEICNQQATLEADIDENIRKLHEVLDIRKTELIYRLQEITQAKLKGLIAQRELIETTQARLSSCLEFIKESLKMSNQEDMLTVKSSILKQVKDLANPSNPNTLKPFKEADIFFLPSKHTTAILQNYGQVSSLSIPDPEKCKATGNGLEVAAVGDQSTITIRAINFEGTPCTEPLESFGCELVSVLTGITARGCVENIGMSKYEISYQPTIKGRHQLQIKVEGQPIKGSPFTVAVKSSTEELNMPILTIPKVGAPWGVALNQRGEVVVAETGRHCITIFYPSGERIFSFGVRGSSLEHFEYPRGVAVNGQGNILVADRENHRIQKFTEQGEFLATVGIKGNRPLEFHLPSDIAVSSRSNKVYVSDSQNHRIQVLNSDLSFSSAFGKKGSGKGQFSSPLGITCDGAGQVYVADNNNHRIQIFSPEGKFVRLFGKHGSVRGDLNYPAGIAVDATGVVYVSDDNHRVSMFTSEGHFLRRFGSSKGLKQSFTEDGIPDSSEGITTPRGVAVDNCGVVYVCDSDNNRVQVF